MTASDGDVDPALLSPEESLDDDDLDSESELWAEDVGIDQGAASAEEAAVHLVPEEDEL